MRNLDDLKKRVARLELLKKPYNRVSVIAPFERFWKINNITELFSSVAAAVRYCEETAAGRRFSVIIDDIPREPGEDPHIHDIATFYDNEFLDDEILEIINASKAAGKGGP